ncbi:hypothetical protein F503_03939 [Ophiostoma piceae UAMH 11346]|uniref:Uncharacterized protein n=1 Tax=Ophiostoma piceae (strain UAMH 11346) TaxID=1262450 RepID=S3BMB4_OPHP1|nr:hypothetical protein F503_03939 [Ophiostoma piceae UAMH 11346]
MCQVPYTFFRMECGHGRNEMREVEWCPSATAKGGSPCETISDKFEVQYCKGYCDSCVKMRDFVENLMEFHRLGLCKKWNINCSRQSDHEKNETATRFDDDTVSTDDVQVQVE